MTHTQIIIFSIFVCLITMTGCASLCKPPKVVIESIRQEGRVLHELKESVNVASKDELAKAITALINSNKALQKYYSIKEEKNVTRSGN